MDFVDWTAYMLISIGSAAYAQIVANLTCSGNCGTYLGYYPWIP